MHTQVIAELSCNHMGSRARALDLVRQAHAAGADAIKLQTWAPDRMVLDPKLMLEDGPWAGRSMMELYREALLPWEDQAAVYAEAAAVGIECFSSVFDLESLTFLEGLGCPRYKIASCELVDLPLIGAVASTRKPLILSSGMGTHTEVERAIRIARMAGATDITLLKCTSAYPAKAEDANLATMAYYKHHFNVNPGISDHTPGIGVAVIAAVLGATMIEKHFTLSRTDGGLDAEFSIVPLELAHLVSQVRQAAAAIGREMFSPVAAEITTRQLRRTLYFTRDLEAGATLAAGDVCTARPALGLAPMFKVGIIGTVLALPVKAGDPVQWQSLVNGPSLAARWI
jgi:pseudaminic acid synthase